MKSTRTMKAPLSQSFIQSHSSLRSAGVDRFRLMLKGGSVKVLSLMVVLMVGGGVWGQLTEGFESGLTTSYQTTTVTLGSGSWSVTNVLAGTTGVNSGAKSAQLQSATGSALITPTLSGGVGTISFYITASSSSGAYQVNISTDNGINWIAATGSPFTISTTKTLRTITVNNSSVNKIQIYRTGATIYIDDFATTTYPTAPLAPTITSITPGNQQLSVAFTAGSNGGSAITNYKYSTDGGSNFTACSPTQTTSPIVITGLTNGTSYNVRIRAVNSIGDGTATASTSATPATTPSAPTISSITPSNGQLSVAFTAGTTGGSAITNYQYSTNGGTNWQTRASGTTASPLVINTLSTNGSTTLTNGVSYDVQIRAVNAIGNGTATATTAATPATTPSVPTISSITPSNGQLSVAFTAPTSDGGSAITNYKYSTNGGSSFSACSPLQTTSPIVITGLTNGTSYNVQIKAVNGIGDGAATASSAATPATTPSAPSITIITPGNQELSVAFTAGATGGAVISNYKYSTDGGSSFTAVSPASTTSPITITSLTNGTTYDVQIKAVNAQGDGIATATTQGTPSAASVAPGAPTITSITPSNGQLSVAFTTGATGGSAITNYKYSTDGGGTFTAVTPSATTSPITITGLINGTSYNVQIKAVNVIGDGAATANTVATPATTPSAPTITGITVGNAQLSVAFTAGATGGSSITNYKYSTDGGSTFTALSPAATTSPITITGLSNGTSYNVQIKAVNAIGDGIATASSVGTPATTSGAPTIGTATAGNGQATVTFTAPVSNGGSAITSYTATSTPGSITGTLNQAGSGTITVTGLTNGTAYTFTVKANNAAGASAASAASNSVTPVLSAPVANAATNLLTNGFTANWDAVTGASSGYLLDVSTSATFTATGTGTLTEGFNAGTSVPSGWAFTAIGGIYTSNGNFGASSPSLSLDATSDRVQTSALSVEATELSFWIKGNGTNALSALLIEGSDGTSWTTIQNLTSLPTGGTTKTYNSSSSPALSNGLIQFRFTYTKSQGNLAFDDILINYATSTPSFVAGYNSKPISGQATVASAVTGLSEGTTYYYRLRATDGSTSSNSNVITVTTKQTPTVTPTVGTYTYSGSAQGPNTATNTGTGSTYTFSYSGTGATTYGPSSTQPTAAGTYTVTASVAADGNFVAASSSATAFTISKATPTISVAPTATDIILGQALSTSTLSGGTATPAGGSFAFTSPSTVPSSVGSYSASVTYTPTDVANYNTATTTTNVLVVSPLTTISNTQFTSARDITRGTTELPIYRFQVDVTNVAATLSSLGFTTPVTATNGNSNYVNTDVTNFKAFLTTSTTFSNATQLGSTSPSGKTQQNAGETLINFTSLATNLNVGTTYYIWLTADVLSAAVAGRTITVNAPTIGITGTVSGTNSATGTQTIISVATNYYLNAGGSLTTSAHYFTSPNGVGTSLSAAGFSYTSNDVTLNIPSSVTNTSDFTLGNGSKIVVQNGGSLTVGASNTITGTIDVNDGGTLTVNNTSVLHTLGTLGTTSSTVIYNANGNQTVAAKPYANITISGSGVKTVGAATVAGTLSLIDATLDIGSSTFVINGPVTQTSGTIDADAGTLSFGNSVEMSLLSSLFSGDIYNLSKSSGAGILTVNDNLNITNNLSTSASTGALVLASAKQLTVGGIITNNGTVTIENGATLVQTGTGTNTGSGTYNVKQAITGSGGSTPNDRFWYLGAALSDASSTALLSSAGNQLWQWNEASFNYALVPTGQQLSQGKSYVLRSGQATETINFSGASLSNGTVNVTGLTRSGTTQNYRGCHLISNPYPSYLDWNTISKTNIGSTMYVRTAVGSTFDMVETFNSVGNIATNNSGTPLTQYIAPMQGFWVKVTTDGQTGSLTMNNTMRSHQSSGSGLRSTAQDFPAFLRFNMLDGQNKDQVILLMSPDASMSLDNFDSEKMSASGYAQFYSTVNATKLVINGMKNVKAKTSIPLTLVMPTSKSYTFQAEEFNIEDGLILLEDKQEGVIQDLTINPTYSFFGNAGTNATRFVVHFQLASAPVLVGGPQELESLGSDELMSDNIQIVSNNQGTVIIRLDEGFKPEGSIRIFDASGRLVEQTDFNDQETTIHLNEQAGMYFVEVAAGKLMVKKKIVIE